MRVLLAAAAVVLLFSCTPVYAADKGGSLTPLFPLEAADEKPRHSGPYVGLLAGYNTSDMNVEQFSFSDHNPFVGGFIGYNARVSERLVLGIEADYVFQDVSASQDISGTTVRLGTDYLATIRARAGVPIGPALLYLTGGVAFTELDASAGAFSDSKTLVGGAFGAGIEAELTKVLFLRVEGLHYWFPDEKLTDGGMSAQADMNQTTVRAGFGFRF